MQPTINQEQTAPASSSDDQEQQQEFQSLFPPPPKQYYKNYGPSATAPSLAPPKPITNQLYYNYGTMLTSEDVIPRPRDNHVRELFQDDDDTHPVDIIGELKRMNRSLCFNFLELLNLLIEKPNAKLQDNELTTMLDLQKYKEEDEKSGGTSTRMEKFAWELKIQQIHLLLMNMSHLLNSYRPHQARQQLITIIQDSLKKRSDATRSLSDILSQCRNMLQFTRDLLSNQDEQQQQQQQQQEHTDFTSESIFATTATATATINPLKRKREEEQEETTTSATSVDN